MKKLLTLCVVHTDTHILLGLKKRGYGQGRWNGFGGKVQPGESIEEAARRELKEEVGIEIGQPQKRGVLAFETAGDPEILEVHVFSGRDFRGRPAESEEMRPEWFKLTEIPYDRMWPDDKYWLPLLLMGRNFEGRFYFLDQEHLLHYQLKEEVPSAV